MNLELAKFRLNNKHKYTEEIKNYENKLDELQKTLQTNLNKEEDNINLKKEIYNLTNNLEKIKKIADVEQYEKLIKNKNELKILKPKRELFKKYQHLNTKTLIKKIGKLYTITSNVRGKIKNKDEELMKNFGIQIPKAEDITNLSNNEENVNQTNNNNNNNNKGELDNNIKFLNKNNDENYNKTIILKKENENDNSESEELLLSYCPICKDNELEFCEKTQITKCLKCGLIKGGVDNNNAFNSQDKIFFYGNYNNQDIIINKLDLIKYGGEELADSIKDNSQNCISFNSSNLCGSSIIFSSKSQHKQYFTSYIKRICSENTCSIKKEDFELIEYEIINRGVIHIDQINYEIVLTCLKHLKKSVSEIFANYYPYLPQITNKIRGIPYISLTKKQENDILQVYDIIKYYHNIELQYDPIQFTSLIYFIVCCIVLKFTDILQKIVVLLKNERNLEKYDLIVGRIVSKIDNKIKYIPLSQLIWMKYNYNIIE